MTEENNKPESAAAPGAAAHQSAKENLEHGKQHLRDAGDVLRANLENSREHVVQAADNLRAAAEKKAQELRERAEVKAHEFRGRAEEAFTDAKARARTFQEDGEDYVRQNPTRSVLTALAAGFLLGLIIRR